MAAPSSRRYSMDDLLRENLGEFGLYQKLNYILVCLPAIFLSFHALSWTFVGEKLNFRCLYPGENETPLFEPPNSVWHQQEANMTIFGKGCYRIQNVSVGSPLSLNTSFNTETCLDGYVWDNPNLILSAVNRWSLVCDRDVIIALIQSLYFVGQFLGSIVFGMLSDKVGRKPIFISAIILQMVCGSFISIAPYWQLVALLRFGVGLGHPGVYIMSCVIGAEFVGPKYRHLSSIGVGVVWAMAVIIMGALAYPIRDYRYLQLITSLPAAVFISYWWIMPESARWLMSHGRFEETNKTLQQIAKWNGKPPLEFAVEQKMKQVKSEMPFWESVSALFKTPRLAVRTLVTFMLWAVATMGYYGLSMNPGFMGGDNRLAFILNGIFQIPGQLFLLSINWIGRKYLASMTFFITALCLGLTLIVPQELLIGNLLLVVIGNSAIGATYSLMYIWTPEYYPTVIRNTAMGASSMIGRAGGLAASFFSLNLAHQYPALVATTFAILSAVASAMAIVLPETAGESLMDRMDQAEQLGIDQPYFISGHGNQKRVRNHLVSRMKGSANTSMTTL